MKQDLRIAITKRMIHEALLKLLEKKTIDKIKINELCEASGVNRATFYRHYETLQDVLREIQSELIRNIPHPNRPPKHPEEVRPKIEVMCRYLYDRAAVLKVLFCNCTDDEMTQNLMSLYAELIHQHRAELPLPAQDEDTYQILMTLFGGGAYALLKNWIMGRIQKTPAELADILFGIISYQGPLGMIPVK